jgi:coproporphyrinogen III oxidase-like Fe-S oxidoreductase
MKVIVNRKWQTNLSTIAELSIEDDSFSGFTLEPPGPDTTSSDQDKRIPEGTYKVEWYNATNPNLAKYNPLPLIYNDVVPENRYILFHNGNYPRNTEGCLLVGASRGKNVVNASVTKLKELKNKLSTVDVDKISVVIMSNYS